jgi:hypothetical protein
MLLRAGRKLGSEKPFPGSDKPSFLPTAVLERMYVDVMLVMTRSACVEEFWTKSFPQAVLVLNMWEPNAGIQ